PGEEQELESELTILENAEKLYEATSRLYEMLYEGDQSVHDQLVLVRNQLEDLESIDKSFEEMKEECTSAEAVVGEVAKFLQQYNSRVEFNPERLEQIRERLGQLTLLKKKYGGTIESIVEHRRTIGREVSLAENFEGEIQKRLQQIAAVRKVASEIAQRLSTKRREVARRVSKAVAEALSELGISSAQFDVNIENRKASGDGDAFVKLGRDFFETTPRGVDFVEFFVSTNPGENVRPLVKVASGGEVSRVMLALKSILAKAERLPLLVFDEIDIGVSGRVAQAVGLSLKNLSNFHQIIAITHLPQIASIAETHFVVEKVRDGKRATTRIRKLTLGERVHEVAKLMSGEEVTAAGLKGARELMKLSD
ncbi:MAG TPA: DNA repair protein RecN, partial [Bacteroidota bacterium]